MIKEIIIIVSIWMIVLCSSIYISYLFRKETYKKIEESFRSLDNKNLFNQIYELSQTEDDKFYNEILKECNLAMLNTINDIEHSKKDYKEYVEQWIHEVKTPLTSIKLICDNQKTEMSYKIIKELEIVSNAVEQTLFYARSDTVSKDYYIKDINLTNVIAQVLIKNKQILIQNNISVETAKTTYLISTDAKWIEFIVSQIVYNSVKYRNEKLPRIKFEISSNPKTTILNIIDNGIGISKADLSRIFDKGFTGSNGRNGANSTGIGLYLCKKLSEKLNIQLEIQSEIGIGTTVLLYFNNTIL